MKKYLLKHKKIKTLIKTSPKKGLFNIIVVPILNEPNVIKYLQSIIKCDKPKTNVEVILIINSSETANNNIIQQNRKTFTELKEFAKQNNTDKLKFYPFIFENLPKKLAGVGLARRYGMDEAVERFYTLGVDGVITSLDADTLVSKNYLTEIENTFLNTKIPGATIYYEHPIQGNDESIEVYNSIINYELYLRYYYQVLKYTGFPYTYHTIGSAFIVRASVYAKQGGIKPKQAGEDFYFLHKIIPLKGFLELNTTTVYPSSRISTRVIFGTGPTIIEISENKRQNYFVYNLQSFLDLKQFVNIWHKFYKIKENDYLIIIKEIPESITTFLNEISFFKDICKINNNTSNIDAFKKAFFQKFDAFKVIKFLNYSHNNFYKKEDVNVVSKQLLELLGYQNKEISAKKILEFYRSLER